MEEGICWLYTEGAGGLDVDTEELVAEDDQLELDIDAGIQDEDQTVEPP